MRPILDAGGNLAFRRTIGLQLVRDKTFLREWAKPGGRRVRVRFRNKAGPIMDVNIFVETTFEDGDTKRRNIGRLHRASDEFCSAESPTSDA